MTDDEKKAAAERRKLIGMLKGLYELSEHATLSGAFKKGAEGAVAHYNRIVARLSALGEIDAEFFPPLEPTDTFHQVGVSARLLRGWLEAGDDEACKAFGLRVDLDGLSQLGEVGRKIRDEWNIQKTVRINVDNDENDEEEL
jgi:hypothetical protein